MKKITNSINNFEYNSDKKCLEGKVGQTNLTLSICEIIVAEIPEIKGFIAEAFSVIEPINGEHRVPNVKFQKGDWYVKILITSGHKYFENNEINNFCFDENTEIKLKNGEIKQIKDICIGDTIIDGGKVTATFKSTSKNQEMYVLNNILVTGDHTLLDEELGVIKVKKHPNSIKYGEYYKPFVYCINTTTKRIIIDNIKFLDWDEVDDMDIVMLRQEMKDLLPERFHLKDIHKFLECGLHPNTLIELDDGRSVPIKQIQVNDQLRFGEQVLGIVEINGKDVDKVKEYEINGFKFIGSSNLRMYSKDLGGCVSTLDMGGIPVKKPRKLYHIITDSKFLRINGTIFFGIQTNYLTVLVLL